MTKKHFTLIAQILKKDLDFVSKTSVNYSNEEIVKGMALQFAHVLAKQNDRFDRKRFLEACGLNDQEIETDRIKR